jgi:uncharacterized glyoxalase superfamily protein PhnB
MSVMLSNRSMPRSTVLPELAYPDIGEAIKRLCEAFGFTLRIRMGDHRAQLNVGDGREPTEYPYGERQYNVEDFAGHHWCFSESIADIDPRDWGGTPAQL